MKLSVVASVTIVLAGIAWAEPAPTPPPPPNLFEIGAKVAIQGVLSFLFETQVSADDVRIPEGEGVLIMKGLKIGNPKGFGDAPAIIVKETRIEADPNLMFSESPTIHRVDLKGVKLDVKHDLKRGVNIKKLLDSASRIEQPDWQDETKPLRIEKCRIEAGDVTLDSDLFLGGARQFKLEPMEFTDAQLGGDAGATAEEAIVKVLEKVVSRVTEEQLPGLD